MTMNTHKRKGNDFEAVSVTTVTSDANYHGGDMNHTSNQDTYEQQQQQLKEEWNDIQQKMNNLRQQLRNENKSTQDPAQALIETLIQRPRALQERVENLPFQAATMKERLEQELQRLEDEWSFKTEQRAERERRLFELQSELDTLTEQSETMNDEIDNLQNIIAKMRQQEQMQRQEYEERMRELAVKIPKLQHLISMYANCTGIKWDYDNNHAYTGYVSVPSQQSFRKFHFARDELPPEEMSDTIWALMEG